MTEKLVRSLVPSILAERGGRMFPVRKVTSDTEFRALLVEKLLDCAGALEEADFGSIRIRRSFLEVLSDILEVVAAMEVMLAPRDLDRLRSIRLARNGRQGTFHPRVAMEFPEPEITME